MRSSEILAAFEEALLTYLFSRQLFKTAISVGSRITPINFFCFSPIVVQQPQSPTTATMNSSNASVHLPSTPVPKELLNINGGTQVVTQRIVEVSEF